MLRYLFLALTVFYIPILPPGYTFDPYHDLLSLNDDQFVDDDHESEVISNGEDYNHDHDDQNQNQSGTSDQNHHQHRHIEEWFEEQLEHDLKWSFALNRYILFFFIF